MAKLPNLPPYKLTGMLQWRKLLKVKRLCRHDARRFAEWLTKRGYQVTDHFEVLEFLYNSWEIMPDELQ